MRRSATARALISALLATICLSYFADAASPGMRQRERSSTQVIYTEIDERDLSNYDRRTHLRTVSGNSVQHRHLSFWNSIFNLVACGVHPHDGCPHPKPHKSGGGGGGSGGGSGGGGGGSGGGSGGGGGGGGGGDDDNANDQFDGNDDNGDDGNDDNGDDGNDDNGDDGNDDNDNGNDDNDNGTPIGEGGDDDKTSLNSNDKDEWKEETALYGSLVAVGGIAVVAAVFAKRRLQNANIDDHLLSGAVGKRKNRFAGLFSNKPRDYAHQGTPGATHYVIA